MQRKFAVGEGCQTAVLKVNISVHSAIVSFHGLESTLNTVILKIYILCI